MKAYDIIKQLQSTLPIYTNAFSDEFTITSLTSAGLIVTAITSKPHKLNNGDYVNIMGALTPNIITDLTNSDGVAYTTTTDWHDLTKGWQKNVEISDADQTEYNGTHELLEVPNRRNFTYKIEGNPTSPATGIPILWYEFPIGYNGWHQITVVDENIFTYPLEREFGSPASGDIKMQTRARISGAVSLDRAFTSYTKQLNNNLWGFVIIGEMSANKDRQIYSDATATFGHGEEYRQLIIQPFNIYVFAPATSDISARRQRDAMEDLIIPLNKSLLRFRFPTGFIENPYSGVIFSHHGFYSYDNAIYIHEFGFEMHGWITYPDTTKPDYNVAFRDIYVDYKKLINDDILMAQHVDLDEVPLE